ncbi:hypothetical protein BDE40_0049 [Litoreibacter halocynthiae]|uniref:GIY-YIG domain-containing protein n=1 Tax=Litoreibacter halocynthiae TaxID=1242689 RepID=A0A4R7LLH0_9RHOB|nr:GIY-YIG nuclease family protein [Litoreibacter halocynthiae]TDT76778.1 hypothetical protein BDE40_0049 [Litoreibacter halocynthiae]
MSSIKCFGLFWRRDLVELDDFWIYGWRPKSLSSTEPDEPETQINFQSGVYVLQNDQRENLYIGQAGRGKSKIGPRLWAHTRNNNRDRWSHFSWFGLTDPKRLPKGSVDDQSEADETEDNARPISFALNELEALLISVGEPALNKRGGDWGDAKEYLQWSHYEDVHLRELYSQNKKLKKRLKRIEKRLGQ